MPRPLTLRLGLAPTIVALILSAAGAADRDDVVIADFEGADHRPWAAEGTAFGSGPARGTLPGQMHVEGYLGQGLISSFHGGDDSTGTLTSPPFRLDRPYLNFLIGGGKYPGETSLELVIDGAVARTATGPNDRPGGSERLDWASWNVSDLVGKEAVLRAVNRRKGGWGHVSVDQVVLSDRPRGLVPADREVVVEARYWHLPVGRDAPLRRVRISEEGRMIREFDIKLAEDRGDFRTFADLGGFRGRTLKIAASLPVGSGALGRITQAEEVPDAEALYREADRPQFHFTSGRGWLNDPNGLVWLDGEYHLFYQHNPYGWDWGNMHWGHAVSRDLIRWTELPIALYPRAYGDWAFSGSAVIDHRNTAGFGPAGSSPMVAAFTSTGRGECIAYSLDRGRTWSEYPGNPVVKHRGRDPRLLWHGPTARWVMAVYDEEGDGRAIAFHSSPDLKSWTYESRIDGFFECPDLFELPAPGEPGGKLWVLHAADGAYMLGDFDGHRFEPRPGGKLRNRFGHFYAAQTFSDEPRGRRVQIGWAQEISFPGMPFNQQMTVPCELELRRTDEGPRLFARPVEELATLRTHGRHWGDHKAGEGVVVDSPGELFDARVEAELGGDGTARLTFRGGEVVLDAARKTIMAGGVSASMAAVRGVVRLRVLADRGSFEVFGDDGRVAISSARSGRERAGPLALSVTGEGSRVRSLDLDELTSAWATASPGPGPR